VDTFLDGPRMYEGMAAFWPTADDDPESSPQNVEYAQLVRPMPKLVFYNTLEHPGCSTTVVAGDRLADTVAELRARPGTRHLLYGGANLAATFMRRDFIGEYWLFINPVAPRGRDLALLRARDSARTLARGSADVRRRGGPARYARP
jgi:dihydrofolate reductase